jgi:hypothetical protein
MAERGRLPAGHGVGHRRAVGAGGRQAEIGQLVVEEEAADHAARAEDALDRGGHRQGVPIGVDDDHVGGAAGSGLLSVPRRGARGLFRPRRVGRGGLADQGGALGDIAVAEQALDRHRHEGGSAM